MIFFSVNLKTLHLYVIEFFVLTQSDYNAEAFLKIAGGSILITTAIWVLLDNIKVFAL